MKKIKKKVSRRYLYIGITIIVIIALFLTYYFMFRGEREHISPYGEWFVTITGKSIDYALCPRFPRKWELSEGQLRYVRYIPNWMFWFSDKCRELI